MAREYLQGRYIPINPNKYVGDINNIQYRSSWEKKFLLWCDTNPKIIKFSSEELIIPYFSPVDKKYHRYFVDFLIQVKNTAGELKTYAVEIKPKAQTEMPKVPKRQTKAYMESIQTYMVNQAKWKAAEKFCNENNMTFQILTETDLGIKR